MSGLDWLMYANIAVWLGLGAYLAFVARAQGALAHRLEHMEVEADDEHSEARHV